MTKYVVNSSSGSGKQKSANQIVGATVSSIPSEQARNTNNKKNNQRSSVIAPSDEFLAFWGENVDPSWFEGRKMISPFMVIIIFLTALTFYLCGRLLFAPGEIEQILFSKEEQASAASQEVLTTPPGATSATEEESSLMQSLEEEQKTKQQNQNLQNTPPLKAEEKEVSKDIKPSSSPQQGSNLKQSSKVLNQASSKKNSKNKH